MSDTNTYVLLEKIQTEIREIRKTSDVIADEQRKIRLLEEFKLRLKFDPNFEGNTPTQLTMRLNNIAKFGNLDLLSDG